MIAPTKRLSLRELDDQHLMKIRLKKKLPKLRL